jgi:hypothetical protein
MKYHFKNIKNGQIGSGYTVIQITDNKAEIDPADTEAILLAEKNGGELVPKVMKTAEGEPK